MASTNPSKNRGYTGIALGAGLGMLVGIIIALIANLSIPILILFGLPLGAGIGLLIGRPQQKDEEEPQSPA